MNEEKVEKAERITLPRLPVIENDEELHAVIGAFAVVKAQIKELEASAKQIGDQIIDSIFARGQLSYTIPGVVKANVQSKTTVTISRPALIAAGVDVAVVDAATKITESEPFVRLYGKRDGDVE